MTIVKVLRFVLRFLSLVAMILACASSGHEGTTLMMLWAILLAVTSLTMTEKIR